MVNRFGVLVDLTTYLNELNMHVQGKNQPISTMFQKITAFEFKFKLWQSHVKANNCIHFPALVTYNPKDNEKYH